MIWGQRTTLARTYRHIDLVEHGHPLARIDERDVLRGRHDDSAWGLERPHSQL
jgi:hypothetical protein